MASEKISLLLSEGKSIFFGGKEVEIERSISKGEFLSGSCFGNNSISTASSSSTLLTKKFNPLSFKSSSSKDENLGHNYELDKEQKDVPITTSAVPIDITNHPLHWTANWCAVIIRGRSLWPTTNSTLKEKT